MTTDRPLGQKFSQVYLDRSVPNHDGERWRIRLASFLREEFSTDQVLAKKIRSEIGLEFYNSATYGVYFDYPRIMKSIDYVVMLNLCTVIFYHLATMNARIAENWHNHFNRCSKEENVSYLMDEMGGVHPAVDAEFQHNLATTISGLNAPRYRAALTAFSGIQPALDREDTRQAIRQVFDTAENIVKMMTGAKGLDASVIQRQLTNKIRDNWDEGAAKDAANQMMAGFVNWVNAAHSYRHFEGQPDAAEPPLDLAILMISVGASYIRWLIDQDQQVQQNQTDPSPA